MFKTVQGHSLFPSQQFLTIPVSITNVLHRISLWFKCLLIIAYWCTSLCIFPHPIWAA